MLPHAPHRSPPVVAHRAPSPRLWRRAGSALALTLALGTGELACGGDDDSPTPPEKPAGASGQAGAGGQAGSGSGGAIGKGGTAGSDLCTGGTAGSGSPCPAGSSGANGASGAAGANGASGVGGAGGANGASGSAGAGGSSGIGFEEGEDQPGDEATVDRHDQFAFMQPLPALSLERRGIFQTGKALFEVPWVAAPATLSDRDGLGPLFNASSCVACHNRNGRGAPPEPGLPALSLLLRLSVMLPGGATAPEPTYGDQIQPLAIGAVPPEGRVTLVYTDHEGTFADGTTYTLRRPQFIVENTNYGPLAPNLLTSPRLAQPLVGLGLLAAIDGAALALAADPDDANGDGISGRINQVPGGAGAPGRFGWKANQLDLEAQNAGAMLGDMGITSPPLPNEACSAAQTACLDAPDGGSPELSATALAALNFYTATSAVPSRPSAADPEVLAGKGVFHQLGCAACHRPSWTTGSPPGLPELAGQHVWPYSDLLLHDMGDDLADGRPDHEASGREWRTPPLWGIGLSALVSSGGAIGATFLHDGRARSITEAILWHGGEATAAREAFRQTGASERALLDRFVNSL